MGFRSHGLTAIGRGYDTWLGYYHMAEDYFTHKQNVKLSGDCCPGCAGEYLDFSNSSAEDEVNHPLTDKGGVYSAYVFAAEAQRLMRRHVSVYAGRPFFAYLPFQSVHGPEEVPESFKELYNQSGSEHYIATESRRTHQGMVTALDEAVGNLTDTFKETGLYNHSLIWFSSDNGGPLGAANNFPLRYGDNDARTHARTQHHAERLAISV